MDLSLLTSIELETIGDPGARAAIRGLLNLVEQLLAENQALRAEVQRLKGEHAKPRFKPKPPAPDGTDYSSEQERHEPKPHRKSSKLDRIRIDRTERLTVDRATLPADVKYQGIETVTVQD